MGVRNCLLMSVCVLLAASAVGAPGTAAPGTTPATNPNVIFSNALQDVPGKHLVVVNLVFDPKSGHRSLPHRHPGSVYVYVTKGTLKLAVEGQPVQVVHTGESFFEQPGALHTVAESASPTEAATAIAVMIVPDGAPLLTVEPEAAKAASTEPPKEASKDSAKSLTGQERAEAVGQGLVGSPAPKLVLTTIDGQKIDLARFYGHKSVYLKFWATWCQPCREQMPHFEHAYETAGPNMAVIAVNVGFNDSLDEIRTFREKFGIKMPIVMDDGTLGSALNLRVTPQHVIIGRDGRIQYVGHAINDRLESELAAAKAQIGSAHLANSPVATPAAPAGVRTDQPEYAVGDALPDISVATLAGSDFNLRDPQSRRPTVLVFMSPWCESYLATSRPVMAESCRQVREQVESLARQGGGTRLRWLAVASGVWATRTDLSVYQAKYSTGIPLTLDESDRLFRSFRVMKVPTLLLADADGKIVQRVDGFDAALPDALGKLSN
jgi:quercetin dioxygenase-like cupin family protein/peroxiredoxin